MIHNSRIQEFSYYESTFSNQSSELEICFIYKIIQPDKRHTLPVLLQKYEKSTHYNKFEVTLMLNKNIKD